ncbi:MAG: hypothetical protein LAN63_05290 [Acidobacteriia bacterium]|nr:hypothetical protein [Terriglobia bacterium]
MSLVGKLSRAGGGERLGLGRSSGLRTSLGDDHACNFRQYFLQFFRLLPGEGLPGVRRAVSLDQQLRVVGIREELDLLDSV